MKVYTKVVWQWVGDELRQVETVSYEYNGPVDLLKGGGDAAYYSGQERLFNEQADSAEFLGGVFRGEVAPAYKKWGSLIADSGSVANQEEQATKAMADVRGSVGAQQQAYEQDMASMGRDFSLPEYAGARQQAGITAAGMEAGAGTGARQRVRDMEVAQLQDYVGMGMGTPTTAAQASNAAASSLNSASAGRNIYDAQQARGVSQVAQLGTNIYGSTFGSGTSYGKDGGLMLKLKQGGFVNRRAAQRYASGGPVQHFAPGGFARVAPVVPLPPPPIPRPSTAEIVGGQAGTPLGLNMMRDGSGKLIQMVGRATDSPSVTSFGYGLEQGPNALKAQAAHQEAIQGTEAFKNAAMVDKAMSEVGLAQPAAAAQPAAGVMAPALETGVAGEGAAALAPVATDVAASTGALTTAAAVDSGAMGAGAALGSAVPVLGAGLALYGIGSAAGWWADGGPVEQQGISRGGDEGGVTPGSVADTGEVDGPGGPKDDMINAQLSDGEYVFPKGAVMFYGLDKLDKMRQKGLEYEKQMGIA